MTVDTASVPAGAPAGVLPRTRRHVFAGTSHNPLASHPDAYVATLRDFIAAADRATARDG